MKHNRYNVFRQVLVKFIIKAGMLYFIKSFLHFRSIGVECGNVCGCLFLFSS